MPSILYISPAGTSGYAEAAKNYIIALSQYFKIQWQPLYYDDSLSNPTLKELLIQQFIQTISNPDVLIIHNTADRWEELKNKYDKPSIKKRIGITVWETDKLHPDWVKHCNQDWLDEIWVPVKWNKEVFELSGVLKPIKVVPHIFYEPDFTPNGSLSQPVNYLIPNQLQNYFRFYTIGQWNERKGITETIHAFCKAFTTNDKVCLVVKTFWAKYSSEQQKICQQKLNHILQQYSNPPIIHLITSHLSRNDILLLHQSCHTYVSLCKSEGWGLGAFDATSLGNTVIITGYGGHTEFLPQNYTQYVNFTLQQVSGMPYIPWYSSSQNWAIPNEDDAIEKMRLSFRNNIRTKISKLSNHVVVKFGINSIDWQKIV